MPIKTLRETTVIRYLGDMEISKTVQQLAKLNVNELSKYKKKRSKGIITNS